MSNQPDNEYWEKFFTDAGISDEFVSTYASIFMENRILESRLSGTDYVLLNNVLKDMGITAGGDRLAIVEHVKKIGKEKRDNSPSFLKSSTDFTNIKEYLHKLMVDLDVDLNNDNPDIRRYLYVKLCNSEDARSLFRTLLYLFQEYFEKNVLKVGDKGDILCAFLKEGEAIDDTITPSVLHISLAINDHPIHKPVLISQDVLKKSNRKSASSIVREVGTQHIVKYAHMVDSSTADSSAAEDKDGLPLKRARICQKAKNEDLWGELGAHTNVTEWQGKHIEMDVLIYTRDEEVCKKLAVYLGLIYLEESVTKNDVNANVDVVLQLNTRNERAKTQNLVQCHISQQLILGRNNVALTGNYNLFASAKTLVKAVIYEKKTRIYYENVLKYSNYNIEIPESPLTLHYIIALAEIEKNFLKIETNIRAFFQESHTLYEIKLPLFSVLPFYILRIFAEVLKSEYFNKELSFHSIK